MDSSVNCHGSLLRVEGAQQMSLQGEEGEAFAGTWVHLHSGGCPAGVSAGRGGGTLCRDMCAFRVESAQQVCVQGE